MYHPIPIQLMLMKHQRPLTAILMQQKIHQAQLSMFCQTMTTKASMFMAQKIMEQPILLVQKI